MSHDTDYISISLTRVGHREMLWRIRKGYFGWFTIGWYVGNEYGL